ncbi:Uncharacterized protein TCM_043721 [Theobroma cacao]|uniref:DUF4283 domain-containing protein n=1 Tax=Theobroma cacao TaxID=3641 RepID=A0A061FPQ9_THECC|nr:Uncharacterized protein TCM_043721 [Theobroma cacao]
MTVEGTLLLIFHASTCIVNKWMNYKHILIHLSNEQDFNRIWTKQTWFIANQKMRVFKWTPEFETEKEPSTVPVWISFPNLKAHLFEKSALLLIAKAIGNPLWIDEATANGTRPSVARVCIEYDCLKLPVDSVWIVVSKRGSKDMLGGYLQKVEFSPMSEYCNHCCHVGHSVSECLIVGTKSTTHKQGGKTAFESSHGRTHNNALSDQKDTEERTTMDGRENVALVEKKKTRSRRYLRNLIYGGKRFAVLESVEEDENQEQDQMEKHGITEDMNNILAKEKTSLGRSVDVGKRKESDTGETYELEDGRRLSCEDPNTKQQLQCKIGKGKERHVEKEIANAGNVSCHLTGHGDRRSGNRRR